MSNWHVCSTNILHANEPDVINVTYQNAMLCYKIKAALIENAGIILYLLAMHTSTEGCIEAAKFEKSGVELTSCTI
mgnify:FL=1